MSTSQRCVDRRTLQSAHASVLAAMEGSEFPWEAAQRGQRGGGLLTKLTGSSLEFYEHRTYNMGDDPRFIDWGASARGGQILVKSFRDEVSPTVDVLLDLSNSMFIAGRKEVRVWELVYWVAECSKRAGAPARIFGLAEELSLISIEDLLSYRIAFMPRTLPITPSLDIRRVPLRRDSLRIMISDLLWPESPAEILKILGQGAVLLAPRCADESNPDWSGNMVLVDNESDCELEVTVTPDFVKCYRESYDRHFSLWTEAVEHSQGRFLSVPSELDLTAVLQDLCVQVHLERRR